MADQPARFTLTLTLSDRFGRPMAMAIPIDDIAGDAVRISPRAVGELKVGLLGSMDQTVSMMRRREFRKDLFKDACRRLGALLAERMEDAEGWHDSSRIEPAREQLGGDWPKYG